MDGEPLDSNKAKDLIRGILQGGKVAFTKHAREEMENDDISQVDVVNVMRGGLVENAEMEKGTWRYRIRTQFFYAVIAFRSEDELVVVTTWRLKR